MSALLDLVVPGSGAVVKALALIVEIGNQMIEVQRACKRLHNGLETIFHELQILEEKGQLPKSDSLDRYVAVVDKSLRCLQHYRGKKLVFRFIKHQTMMNEIRHINEEIEMLFRVFNLAGTAAMMEWKQQWEVEQRAQQEVMAANTMLILRELQDTRAQAEALFTLRYELEKGDQREDKDMVRVMSSMESTVMRVSKASVDGLPPWFLPADDVEFDAEGFAWGSYGSVHHGVWLGTNVVVKCFIVDAKGIDERDRKKIEAEMNLWYKFNHPNVIKMFGACHVSLPPFIVCEDASNGDLCSFLTRSETNKRHMWRLLYESALGLGYIHKQNVVHGDLKLNNILVGADGQAKMSDFGLSTVRSCSTMSKAEAVDANSIGALRWRAPECLTKQPVFASDVYSFAMCIIEAVTNAVPFYGLPDDAVRENLRNGDIPDRPDGIADDVWDLVVGMTNAVPTKRMSLQQVIERLRDLKENDQATDACDLPTSDDSRSFHNERSSKSSSPRSKNSAERPRQTDAPVSSPRPSNETPIAERLKQVASASDSEKEEMLLNLVQDCADSEQRAALYAANGVQLLMSLIRAGQTFLTQVYALECLQWDIASDSRVSRLELDALRDCLRDPAPQEFVALKDALRNGTGPATTEAVVRCACTAIKDHCDGLRKAGVIEPLIALLRNGTDAQKLWAAEALRKLTITNGACRLEAVEKEAIGQLVTLILVGTPEQKHRATWALGNLALYSEASPLISQRKAIPALVTLLRTGVDLHRLSVLYALQCIVFNNAASAQEIASEGAATLLVAVLTGGTSDQNLYATSVIAHIVENATIATEVARLGAIPPLVALLGSESTRQVEEAVRSIANLVGYATALGDDVVKHGAIAPLVQILQSGTENGKEYAAHTLASISSNPATAAEIVRHGAIPVAIALVASGTDEQKTIATAVLGNLAAENTQAGGEIVRHGAIKPMAVYLASAPYCPRRTETVRTIYCLVKGNPAVAEAIAQQGVIGPLSQLLQAGSDAEKKTAAFTLAYMTINPSIGTEIMNAGAIPSLVALLGAGTDAQKWSSSSALSRLASNNTLVLHEIVRQGAVAPLVAVLDRSGQGGGEAARALGNIATGGSSFGKTIASQGAIPLLVKLLSNGSDTEKSSAARTLGNLANKNPDLVAEITRHEAVAPLRQLQHKGTSDQVRAAKYALHQLQRPSCCLIS